MRQITLTILFVLLLALPLMGARYFLGVVTVDSDTTAPTPNPATISSATAISSSVITIVSTIGTDVSTPIEYKFVCTAGGGNDSSWQESNTYTDSGLTASTQYTYTVQMRDSLENTGIASSGASATTNSTVTRYLDSIIGSDSYDGTSATVDGGSVGPWLTLDYALDEAASDTDILIAEGDYVGYSNSNRAANTGWITLMPNGVVDVNIITGISEWKYPDTFAELYLHFNGINFYHCGFHAEAAGHIKFSNCVFTGDGYDPNEGYDAASSDMAIRLENAWRDITIESCDFGGDGNDLVTDGYASMSFGGQDLSDFGGGYKACIYLSPTGVPYDSNALYSEGFFDRLDVNNCTFTLCDTAVKAAINDSTITNNTISYCTWDAISIQGVNQGADMNDAGNMCYITDNTVDYVAKLNGNHSDCLQLNDSYSSMRLAYRYLTVSRNVFSNFDEQGLYGESSHFGSHHVYATDNLVHDGGYYLGTAYGLRLLWARGDVYVNNNTTVLGANGVNNASALLVDPRGAFNWVHSPPTHIAPVGEPNSANEDPTDLDVTAYGNLAKEISFSADNAGITMVAEDYNFCDIINTGMTTHSWGSNSQDFNEIDFDALFADPNNPQNGLASASGAIDQMPTSLLNATDRLGNTRVNIVGVGSETDIGDIGSDEKQN